MYADKRRGRAGSCGNRRRCCLRPPPRIQVVLSAFIGVYLRFHFASEQKEGMGLARWPMQRREKLRTQIKFGSIRVDPRSMIQPSARLANPHAGTAEPVRVARP